MREIVASAGPLTKVILRIGSAVGFDPTSQKLAKQAAQQDI
jgi:hypothetical protein